MHIPLVAEQEFEPASPDGEIRLPEPEDLIRLEVRDEAGEVRHGDGDIFGLD